MNLLEHWQRRSAEVLGINRRNLDLVFADYHSGRFEDLDDKLRTKEILNAAEVTVPRTLAVIRAVSDAGAALDSLAGEDEIVVKPARGSGGKGILVLARAGFGWMLPDGEHLTRADVLAHIAEILSGVHSLDETESAVIVEERIHPHPFLQELYSAGLADLRIVLHHGRVLQAMWRVPTRASKGKANLHGGGVGLGVDLTTGRTTGATARGKVMELHPDTGAPLSGREIPFWQESLELAREAATLFDVGYLGVDLTLDAQRGPMILEVNARPGLQVQVANRAGLPVPAATLSRFDRITFAVTWLLLAALALSPAAAWLAQRRWGQATDALTLGSFATAAADTTVTTVDPGGIEWEDEETPVSQRSDLFRRARAAAASGDTLQALKLYDAATSDPEVAPFALNNAALLQHAQGRNDAAVTLLRDAVERYPTYYRGHYNLGLFLYDAGRTSEARQSFEEALRLRPSHAGSWAQLGEILAQQRDVSGAVAAYDNAVRYQPDTRRYRMEEALLLQEAGDHVRAAKRFREVLQLRPDSEPAAYGWARAVRDGALDVDSAEIRQVLDRHTEGSDPSVRCLVLYGELAWQERDLVAGFRAFEKLRKKGIRPGHSGLAAAACALELGLWQRVRVLLEEATDGDRFTQKQRELCELGEALTGAEATTTSPPLAAMQATLEELQERARAWGPLDRRLEDSSYVPATLVLWGAAVLADRAGDTSRAQLLRRLLETTTPAFAPLLHERFDAAVARGETDTARDLGDRIRTVDPHNPVVLVALARMEFDAGNSRRAGRLLARLPATGQKSTEVQVLAARILAKEGDLDGALETLRALAKKAPRDVEVKVALGEVLSRANRHEQSAATLRAALDLDPGRKDVRLALARELMRQRDYAGATEQWDRLIHLEGETSSARFNLGLCLQRQGRNQEAIRQYDHAIQLEPEKYQAWYNRALAMEKLGRPEEARGSYEHVLSLRPDHEPSRARLSRLQGE